ncbi:MAG: amidohydrolase family protein, partial [Clostridiales bacterium]
GFALWPDVEKYLQGRKLSFDTSFLAGRIDPSLMRRIIRNHGIDKILFGTDYPWQSVAENRDFVLDLHLGAEAEQAIFYDNAASLLRL